MRSRNIPRATLALALFFAPPLHAETVAAPVPPPKTFKDWVIGCDNLRRCTAIGLSPDTEFAGHVVVSRDGAGAAPPHVDLIARADTPITAPATLSLLVDGAPVPGLSATSWPALSDGRDASVVRVRLSERDGALLLQRMREAHTLDLKVTGADQPPFGAAISLAGTAAAFLHMDDAQRRLGTETALINPGAAPAATVPPIPSVPVLKSVVMRPVAEPPATLPTGITPSDPDDCPGIDPRTSLIRLSPSLDLWRICYVRAHYRELQTFWIAGQDGVKPASFVIPGRAPGEEGAAVLVNPTLSRDGRVIEAFDLGRGLGDCGTYSKWVWTGTAFHLAYLSEMPQCRGVTLDDWPVTYTSLWK